MAAVQSNIVKWVKASVIKYFTDIASGNSIPMLAEGVDERSESTMRVNHSELRIQGPYISQLSKSIWKLTLEINVFLTVFMEMSGDAYELYDWGGIFVSAMNSPINIYKYGSGVEDTGDFIGCLRVKNSKSQDIQFFDFGVAGNDTRVRQAEIDAAFEMMTTLGE